MRKTRRPTHPGEILREEFLIPLGIKQTELAKHIRCDWKVINRIVNEKSSVSADIAIKLGAALGTTAEFWMNAQKSVDLFNARENLVQLPPLLKAS